MVANTNQIGLCNRSLYQIAARAQVSSISPSDGSAAANACSTLFVSTFTQLARSAWWDCLSKQSPLTLIGAAPGTPEGGATGIGLTVPQPWLYLYQYPSDCLKARNVLPNYLPQGTGTVPLTTINNAAPIRLGTRRQIPFRVVYSTDANNNPLQVLVTNQSQAQLNYIVNQPNPVIWDSQFESAFVASLAAFLVPALALHMPLMQLQISMAERLIAEARASDANEGSNTQDNVPDWISVRGGSSGSWYGGNWGCGYDNVAWPAVV